MQYYRRASHTIYDCKYHLVWITKYRYKVLVGDIGNRARDLIQQICHDNGAEIIRGKILPDHVHIYISVPPYQSISKLVQYLKGKTSRKIQQVKAALAVNQELIKLYWEIGSKIHLKQKDEGWGAKVIENLAKDLKSSFPDLKGFSSRNLKYMVHFAKEYPGRSIGQQVVAQIPWGHNILLLQRLDILEDRLWYAHKTIEHGWSRSVLLHWLDSNLHQREGKAITNFQNTLPSPQSDLAHQSLKDPYCFDFLKLRDKHDEKELESALLDHVQKFLLELGTGFSFVGRQVQLEIGDQDFYIDLLFYHYKLRCFIIVELKTTDFKPEFAGKMNFYLSAVNGKMKHQDDQPTIGLLLCKGKNRVVAEYALRDVNKPIGISQYEAKILEPLPDDLKGSLPSIQQIEQELEGRE